MAYPVFPRPRQNAVDIVGEHVEIEMAMAVDKHQAAPSSFST